MITMIGAANMLAIMASKSDASFKSRNAAKKRYMSQDYAREHQVLVDFFANDPELTHRVNLFIL